MEYQDNDTLECILSRPTTMSSLIQKSNTNLNMQMFQVQFSLDQPTGPLQSLSCNVFQSYLCHFLVSDLAILAQKWSKIAAQRKRFILVFAIFLLMDLGPNQQQHPTVQCGTNAAGILTFIMSA